MATTYPNLEVIGNMVPPHLVPFKIQENKYIDANTNKYTIFPQIGAFEITFQNHLIYSKKGTTNWPHIPTVLGKIAIVLDPNTAPPEVSPPKRLPPKKKNMVKPSYEQYLSEEARTEKAKVSQWMRDSEVTVPKQHHGEKG